ncbi:MAG: adenosine kinase [Bacteroidaceae bacterium]|nr:adenosine kinase [Bacteroidaceae bacterium]
MQKIIGIGNALVDVLAEVGDDSLLEKAGLERGGMHLINEAEADNIKQIFSSMRLHKATGGSARNTMHALARLGATPGFIGATGHDDTGAFFEGHCHELGIELHLVNKPMPSGIAYTFVSADGERTFGTYLGAASMLEASDIRPEVFEDYDYFYVEGYLVQNHEMILRAIKTAREAGLRICIDLASFNIVAGDLDFFHTLVSEYVDIVFANEEEAHSFTGETDPLKAIEKIAALTDIAVVKLGSQGVAVMKDGKRIVEPGIEVKRVVDTTGAGDFFAGGFMYGLINGCSLRQCAQMGGVMGGNVIQYYGTTIPQEEWGKIKFLISEIKQQKAV